MNTELHNYEHRNRRFLGWTFLYIAIFLALGLGFYALASKIKTHTLPVGQIDLVVPHSQYLVGEPITFQIINKLNANIFVQNKCPTEPLEVYIKKDGSWVRLHDTADINSCPKGSRQVQIAANSTLTGNFNAWPSLFKQPGQYRIVAVVEHYNSLPYQDFEIITPPAPAPEPAAVQAPAASSQQNTTQSASSQQLKSRTVAVSGGTISVQYSSTQIYVLGIQPSAGCRYEGGRSGPSVQVTFKCGENETQVSLSLRGGVLTQQVQTGEDGD